MPVSQNRDNYASLHQHFRWLVPEKFNIAQVCCGRWAQGPDAKNKIAIKAMETPAVGLFHSYFDLQQHASRLSNVLAVLGVRRGDRVAVVDDAGVECPGGVAGDVALNRFDQHGHPDPIFFLGYWKNEAATRAKFTGDWCRTGDLATRDADGYLWYKGRSDDVFKAAGYRIGPGEIENCLVKHPAVANAAVVPKPDKARGAVVKAYVVIAPDFERIRPTDIRARASFDDKLAADLQAHVKDRLAPYEYPKEIEFVDALPMTTTGKVQRRVLRLQEEERASLQGQG